MTVNSAGNPVSWDDYYPFGSVMPGRSQISSADNRYKFTGKERDTETNYDYFACPPMLAGGVHGIMMQG